MLKGWKTYLCGIGMVLAAGANYMGYISKETFEFIAILLGGGGIMALRAGVAKGGK